MPQALQACTGYVTTKGKAGNLGSLLTMNS